MKMRTTSSNLLGTASALALAATAIIGAAAPQPAAAAQGVYGGGSTLLSLFARQIFDCYHGVTLPGDGYSFSSSFASSFSWSPATPGLLPTTCTIGALSTIEGLYAGVGSGSGQRGFIANDPHQLLQSPNTTTVPNFFPLPANPPLYVDGSGVSPFGTYPYPQLDFAASDAPLPNSTATRWNANSLTTGSYSSFTPSTNWQTLATTATIAATASTTVNYSTAKYGQPIQIPIAEVPVAIAINVATTTAATWTIRSALSPNTQPGGAIQLSAAQLCAIFSGTVRDWHSPASIASLTSSGGAAALVSQLFDADNTNATTHTGAPYTNNSLPISVAYRSDDSGTSFILTNYLAAVCPLLDNGSINGPYFANNYAKIFTGAGRTTGATANLPSTSFANLIANIKTVTGTDVTMGSNPWSGESGDGAVAAEINNNSANSGRIGYLSNDFTKPYSTSATAPLSASIQDEHLRANGVNHPGDTGTLGSAQNFIAPTPLSAFNAWRHITAPTAPATYNAWNVYNQTFTSGTSGGVWLTGKFILPLDTDVNAYPVTGTTFLELYSCYADSAGTRVPAIANFVSWLVGGGLGTLTVGTPSTSTAASPKYDRDVANDLRNNGFHEIPPQLSDAILRQYVFAGFPYNTAIAAYNRSGSQTEGCVGVTGGGAH